MCFLGFRFRSSITLTHHKEPQQKLSFAIIPFCGFGISVRIYGIGRVQSLEFRAVYLEAQGT